MGAPKSFRFPIDTPFSESPFLKDVRERMRATSIPPAVGYDGKPIKEKGFDSIWLDEMSEFRWTPPEKKAESPISDAPVTVSPEAGSW